jgi:hypothetical protein
MSDQKSGVAELLKTVSKYIYWELCIPLVERYMPYITFYKYNKEGSHTRVWGPKNENKKDVNKYKVRKDIQYLW